MLKTHPFQEPLEGVLQQNETGNQRGQAALRPSTAEMAARMGRQGAAEQWARAERETAPGERTSGGRGWADVGKARTNEAHPGEAAQPSSGEKKAPPRNPVGAQSWLKDWSSQLLMPGLACCLSWTCKHGSTGLQQLVTSKNQVTPSS